MKHRLIKQVLNLIVYNLIDFTVELFDFKIVNFKCDIIFPKTYFYYLFHLKEIKRSMQLQSQ